MPLNYESWMNGEDRGPLDVPTADVALVVVDMQNCFCKPLDSISHPPGMEIGNFGLVVPGCAALVDAAHAAGHPVIFTRYIHLPGNADDLPPRGRRAGRAPLVEYLIEGTPEVDVVDELGRRPGDFVIDKSRPSAFYGTRLEPLLTSRGIKSVVICGITTNVCVETTARDAYQRGYDTYVIEDATAEYETSRHWHSLYTINWCFGSVATVADVERSWAA